MSSPEEVKFIKSVCRLSPMLAKWPVRAGAGRPSRPFRPRMAVSLDEKRMNPVLRGHDGLEGRPTDEPFPFCGLMYLGMCQVRANRPSLIQTPIAPESNGAESVKPLHLAGPYGKNKSSPLPSLTIHLGKDEARNWKGTL